MALTLPNHIAHCRVQGRTVLLDLKNDRYFGLAPRLEEPFADLVSPEGLLDRVKGAELIRLGLAIEGRRAPEQRLDPPRASHVEDNPFAGVSRVGVLQVWAHLTAARRAVRSVDAVIARLARRKTVTTSMDDRLMQATDQFLAARALVPIAPVCLQDSVALIDFLARRGFHPRLVFGVSLDPFSAHCWVQAADVVLNDALLRARTHTQILVA